MACPRCGEICHCHPDLRAAASRAPLPKRFEVDTESPRPPSAAMLIDPEQYDATEEQFSASLETPGVSASRFVPDPGTSAVFTDDAVRAGTGPVFETEDQSRAQTFSGDAAAAGAANQPETQEPEAAAVSQTSVVEVNPGSPGIEDGGSSGDPNAWKEEVAARLSSYRARRKPRPPKYPSLSLSFESPVPAPPSVGVRNSELQTALAVDHRQHTSAENPPQAVRFLPAEDLAGPVPALSGRVIEFPRFFAPPETSPDELAEPISEHPRILEAPEVELPAPALGGIVLETTGEQETEARPGFEVPLASASIARRVFAAAIDSSVIAVAGAMFAYIFMKLAKTIPPLPQLLASTAMVAFILWAGYQYLLLTYSGSTPGLRLAKLRLAHFDDSAVRRSTRRWRVLASILSGISLGLGFAWCFLDEDALCWHDRITRTHLASQD
jgi:uncharacterized RDD family membrane protein YckC